MKHSWGCLLLMCGLAAWLTARGEELPPEVSRAAETGMPALLGNVPDGTLSDYGFGVSAERERARLGEPFHLATIAPRALLAYRPDDNPEALLTDTTLWYFPVLVDGAIRCLLVVDRTAAGWEAVSLGYVPLARALDDLLRARAAAGGARPRLVAVFQAREYLYTVPGEAASTLTPLAVPGGGSGGASAALAPQTPAATTLLRLKPLVERNLHEFGAPGKEP